MSSTGKLIAKTQTQWQGSTTTGDAQTAYQRHAARLLKSSQGGIAGLQLGIVQTSKLVSHMSTWHLDSAVDAERQMGDQSHHAIQRSNASQAAALNKQRLESSLALVPITAMYCILPH